jgi:hypothetical protein
MNDESVDASASREKDIEAKKAAAARLQEERQQDFLANLTTFAREGATLRNVDITGKNIRISKEGITLQDDDIKGENITIRMPMAALLLGGGTISIGGGGIGVGGIGPDPPRADRDSGPGADRVFVDGDNKPLPTESDFNDVG